MAQSYLSPACRREDGPGRLPFGARSNEAGIALLQTLGCNRGDGNSWKDTTMAGRFMPSANARGLGERNRAIRRRRRTRRWGHHRKGGLAGGRGGDRSVVLPVVWCDCVWLSSPEVNEEGSWDGKGCHWDTRPVAAHDGGGCCGEESQGASCYTSGTQTNNGPVSLVRRPSWCSVTAVTRESGGGRGSSNG